VAGTEYLGSCNAHPGRRLENKDSHRRPIRAIAFLTWTGVIHSRAPEPEEPIFVKALVAQARPTDELEAVVGHRRCLGPARVDQPLQHLDNAPAAGRGVDLDRQAGTTTVRMRKRRPSSRTSSMKSSDDRSLIRVGAANRGTPRGAPPGAAADGR
jgi:hypothetical protein